MGRRAVNPIDVIEAAYALDLGPREWLAHVGNAVKPLLDDGLGVYAYYYDVTVSPAKWLDDVVMLDDKRANLDAERRLVRADKKPLVEELHVTAEPLESSLQAARKAGNVDLRKHAPYAEFLRAIDASDMLAFHTIEPEGRGVAICAAQRSEQNLDRRTQRLWARVAAHIAAARRLRESLTASKTPVEAVFTPGGRVEHLEGEAATPNARDLLRAAVLRQERARGKLRRAAPEAATEMWTALVSGRWSLVDRFERGERRYIVARSNEPGLRDPRALSPRERVIVQLAVLGKSSKLIAYELGLAPSTVASHLSTAMRKLGVKSRVALIRLATSLAVR